jgi:hypothetical protein
MASCSSSVLRWLVDRRQIYGQRRPFRSELGDFLRNHVPHIAAMDLFVVPTVSFNLLYFWSLSGWPGASLSGST